MIAASIALHCQFKSARTDLLHLNYVTTNVNVMLKIVLPWQKPNIDYGYKTYVTVLGENGTTVGLSSRKLCYCRESTIHPSQSPKRRLGPSLCLDPSRNWVWGTCM